MRDIMANNIISIYIMYIVLYYIVYIIMIYSYPIKTSKNKALLLSFACANFTGITSTLSFVFIGQGIVQETLKIIITNKIIYLLSEIIVIICLNIIINIPWYRIYWVCHILYAIYAITAQLCFLNKYVTFETNHIVIERITLNNLIGYLLVVVIIPIMIAMVIIRIIKFIYDKVKTFKIPNIIWFIVNMGLILLMLPVKKSYSYIEENANDWNKGITEFNTVIIEFTLILAVAFVVLNNIQKKNLRIENRLLREVNEFRYNNYLSNQKREMRIHQLYHDIGNHLKTIQILVYHGENDDAKRYMNNLLLEYTDIRRECYCKNEIINAVLNEKIKTCQQKGIKTEIDINIPEDILIRDIDLMSVFVNVLDNAIEGCQRNSGVTKNININAYVNRDYLTVKIISSKKEKDIVNTNKVKVPKKDIYVHGYGVKILDEIVKRYNGQKDQTVIGDEECILVTLKMIN